MMRMLRENVTYGLSIIQRNNNTVAENDKHLNIVKDDKIAEYFEDSDLDVYPLNDRIVFVKEKDIGYVFYGVYHPKNPFSKDQGRVFNRVSKVFPIK